MVALSGFGISSCSSVSAATFTVLFCSLESCTLLLTDDFAFVISKDTWYFSPLPKELLKDGNMVEVLHVCEFTLQFFTRKEELVRFQRKQLPKNKRHPPGNGKCTTL